MVHHPSPASQRRQAGQRQQRGVSAGGRRRPARRRNPWTAALAILGVVAVLVVSFVLVRWATTPVAVPDQPASAAEAMAILTSIPAADLDRVGIGSATPSVRRISEPALTSPGGRPAVLYIGAEFCPYCAAERWPLIVALARFGTFSNVGTAASSATDVFPSTPTFTFAGSTYTSRFLDLVAVEQDVSGGGSLTEAQRALQQRYSGGGIPFLDFGNRAVLVGSTFSPALLQGVSRDAAAGALRDPATERARAMLGSANLLTAALCLATDQRPAEVCSSPGVLAAAGHLA